MSGSGFRLGDMLQGRTTRLGCICFLWAVT